MYNIALIAVAALVTMSTRFLPFLIFGEKQKTPEIVLYLGKVLPCAIMGMLVVYCLKDVAPLAEATINTESPAWAIDRLSILALKIYHMRQETERTDVDDAHRSACQAKLDVLLEQQRDLSSAIDQLIADIEAGRKYMKVYKQMKMYNDPALNPVLYGGK